MESLGPDLLVSTLGLEVVRHVELAASRIRFPELSTWLEVCPDSRRAGVVLENAQCLCRQMRLLDEQFSRAGLSNQSFEFGQINIVDEAGEVETTGGSIDKGNTESREIVYDRLLDSHTV